MTARSGHRTGSSRNHADTEAAAERAQAKRFAKVLRRELNEINEKLVALEVDWHLHCESEVDVEPPQRLVVARQRVTKIERMLKALTARFPRTT